MESSDRFSFTARKDDHQSIAMQDINSLDEGLLSGSLGSSKEFELTSSSSLRQGLPPLLELGKV